MKRSRVLPQLLMCALVVGLASAALQHTRPAEAQRVPDLNEVASIARVFNQGRVPDLQPSESSTWDGLGPIMVCEDAVSGDEYLVDGTRSLIVRYASASGFERFGRTGSREYLPQELLLVLAEETAARTYAGGTLKGMRRSFEQQAVQVEPVPAAQFAVEYREQLQGVDTFNHIRVMLDATTGDVMAVEQDFDAVDVALEPEVTEPEARSLGAAEGGLPTSCVTDCRLMAIRTLEGQQHLAWSVWLQTGDGESGTVGMVLVDAHSGAVIVGGVGGQ